MSKLDEIFSKNTIAATSEPVGLKDGMIKMISFNKVIIDINKTKQDIKDLMLELIGDEDLLTYGGMGGDVPCVRLDELRQKAEEL